jgi:hypothetical protein
VILPHLVFPGYRFSVNFLLSCRRPADGNFSGRWRDADKFFDFVVGANRVSDGLIFVGVVGVDFEDGRPDGRVFKDRAAVFGRVENRVVVVDVVDDDLERRLGHLRLRFGGKVLDGDDEFDPLDDFPIELVPMVKTFFFYLLSHQSKLRPYF